MRPCWPEGPFGSFEPLRSLTVTGAHAMLLREGDYTPLRGSFVQLGQNGLLSTRGSVPYYGTYPGVEVLGLHR